MNAKEKLIAVMELKAKHLPKLKIKYFTKAHKNAMLKWDEQQAEQTIAKMLELIEIHEMKYCELDSVTCPFCLYHGISSKLKCKACEYDNGCRVSSRWGRFNLAKEGNYNLPIEEIISILEC